MQQIRQETPLGLKALIVRWVVNAFALWVTCLVIPGIEVTGVGATFVAAAVLGVLNALLRPILLLLTLPITVVTLGLFAIVINAAMIQLTASLVEGFAVSGFLAAFFGAIVLSVVSVMVSLFISGPPAGNIRVVVQGSGRPAGDPPPSGSADDYPSHIRRIPPGSNRERGGGRP